MRCARADRQLENGSMKSRKGCSINKFQKCAEQNEFLRKGQRTHVREGKIDGVIATYGDKEKKISE